MSALPFVLIALALLAMVAFVALTGKRRGTMSRERAERQGLRGEEGLRHAEQRRSGDV